MTYFKLAASAAAMTLAAGLAHADPAGCDAGETVVKFSHVTNTDKHPKGIAASLFAERVNAEMDGKMCVEVYPNSTLYDDDKLLEAMLNGDVQMGAPSLSKFEAFTKKFQIFDLPFMFKNMDAVEEFQNSDAGTEMKKSMERRGLSGLEFWHNGLKQFSANKPIEKPEDMKGLKIRIQPSDVIVAQMKVLGASPQPLSFKEVYGALQTGVVDGAENPWSNIWGQKFFEVQDGITETNHGLLDYLVVASTEWLESLDADVRDQMLTILDEVTVERNNAVAQVAEEARQAIADTGEEIRTLSDEQRQEWVEVMQPVWAEFADAVGQENIDLAQEINAKH